MWCGLLGLRRSRSGSRMMISGYDNRLCRGWTCDSVCPPDRVRKGSGLQAGLRVVLS
jgi:hypothetical protein